MKFLLGAWRLSWSTSDQLDHRSEGLGTWGGRGQGEEPRAATVLRTDPLLLLSSTSCVTLGRSHLALGSLPSFPDLVFCFHPGPLDTWADHIMPKMAAHLTSRRLQILPWTTHPAWSVPFAFLILYPTILPVTCFVPVTLILLCPLSGSSPPPLRVSKWLTHSSPPSLSSKVILPIMPAQITILNTALSPSAHRSSFHILIAFQCTLQGIRCLSDSLLLYPHWNVNPTRARISVHSCMPSHSRCAITDEYGIYHTLAGLSEGAWDGWPRMTKYVLTAVGPLWWGGWLCFSIL